MKCVEVDWNETNSQVVPALGDNLTSHVRERQIVARSDRIYRQQTVSPKPVTGTKR